MSGARPLPENFAAGADFKQPEYRLRQTGDVVVDPDLMSTWTITKPPEN